MNSHTWRHDKISSYLYNLCIPSINVSANSYRSYNKNLKVVPKVYPPYTFQLACIDYTIRISMLYPKSAAMCAYQNPYVIDYFLNKVYTISNLMRKAIYMDYFLRCQLSRILTMLNTESPISLHLCTKQFHENRLQTIVQSFLVRKDFRKRDRSPPPHKV